MSGVAYPSLAGAIGNTDAEEGEQVDLGRWADELGISADDLQEMAVFSERQGDKVHSLSRNMSG